MSEYDDMEERFARYCDEYDDDVGACLESGRCQRCRKQNGPLSHIVMCPNCTSVTNQEAAAFAATLREGGGK